MVGVACNEVAVVVLTENVVFRHDSLPDEHKYLQVLMLVC